MKLRDYQEIMSATKPEQVFSMIPSTLQEEFEAYTKMYNPNERFHEIRNFVVMQQLKLLFKKAKEIMQDYTLDEIEDGSTITLYSTSGDVLSFDYDNHINQRICDTYSNDSQILMVMDASWEEKGFFSNYLEKVNSFETYWRGRMDNWNNFQYSVPNVIKSFKTKDKTHYVLLIQKPCRIYPLRKVLDFFDGRMNVRHVVSIVKRLYLYACLIDIAGMTHNAICIDNIYFAPGNEVFPGKKWSVDDIRIVGLYGGWFFTTEKSEKVSAFPREIRDIIPDSVERTAYSSFEVDMLAIKKVAKELLGDVTGRNLFATHSLLCEWFNRTTCEKNAYEEFAEFERICESVFGKAKFVDIELPFNM